MKETNFTVLFKSMRTASNLSLNDLSKGIKVSSSYLWELEKVIGTMQNRDNGVKLYANKN